MRRLRAFLQSRGVAAGQEVRRGSGRQAQAVNVPRVHQTIRRERRTAFRSVYAELQILRSYRGAAHSLVTDGGHHGAGHAQSVCRLGGGWRTARARYVGLGAQDHPRRAPPARAGAAQTGAHRDQARAGATDVRQREGGEPECGDPRVSWVYANVSVGVDREPTMPVMPGT